MAEIETATFQGSKIFDIVDDVADQTPGDTALLRDKLHEDFDDAKVRPAIGECLINSAVFGTGMAEIVVEQVKELKPATRPIDGNVSEIGVMPHERPLVKLVPIQPKNFLIDPSATSVDDAMGIAIEEFVPRYKIDMLQEQGVYKDVAIQDDPSETGLEVDESLLGPTPRARQDHPLLRLVPREALLSEGVTEEELKTDSEWQEAVVVVANGGTVLKASVNPYMVQDRPVIAFPWDVVPGRFWGRGVCEKGYSSQKSLDAELRARIDALALTTHPMMAIDSTRIPRNAKFEIRPGRTILTNGDPSSAIMPFQFGQVNQITFNQAAALQQMVQQATGAVDGTAMAAQGGQEATSGGVAMSLGAVIKRQKRTLVNFQNNFLQPLIKKMAYRYMQFSPNEYPVKDFRFNVISSLGVVAREYEVGQLSQILQVTQPGDPIHGAVIKAIIEHLNVSSREEIIQIIEQANQPNPEAQQAAKEAEQLQKALQQAQIGVLQAQGQEFASRGQKYQAEADLYPQELVLKYGDSDKDGQTDSDLPERIQVGQMLLEEKRLAHEIEKARAEHELKKEAEQAKAQKVHAERQQLQQMMQQNAQQLGQVNIEKGKA